MLDDINFGYFRNLELTATFDIKISLNLFTQSTYCALQAKECIDLMDVTR
jgi:hypothetical protein